MIALLNAGFKAIAICDRLATESRNGSYESYLSEVSVREPGRLLPRRMRALRDNHRSQNGSRTRQQRQTANGAAAVYERWPVRRPVAGRPAIQRERRLRHAHRGRF